ncbi:hypothetical protein QQS21_008622 [Conoideocrella luteorostrata]|uniref:Nucleoside phosphorylase domain-containing protein n=1 Tax=Conoideocrella luteorostrata TaxID=1105319 RepID=A0AAJ0CIQ1_9HYPO|nr:hypothetical protein QQS21_008622 [Conoideocrella luteorostrata]
MAAPGDSAVPRRPMEASESEEATPKCAEKGKKELTYSDFVVGWLCALSKEQTAATAMLERRHPDLPKPPNDPNAYTLGSIGKHNIVIACLPEGEIGTNSAAKVATRMISTFPSIKFGLMVGIGGGIPSKVRLGDIVVSTPGAQHPGVVQWDLGKATEGGSFLRTGSLTSPPASLRTALTKLKTEHEMVGSKIPDYLKELEEKYPRLAAKYVRSESLEDPMTPGGASDSLGEVCVHYGLIASGNQVIKDDAFRDRLDKDLGGHVLCVETEAAGLMNDFPCIVIRGICDYADSHKNKDWQEHAAAMAAAFAKELLQYVQPSDVEGELSVQDLLKQVQYDTSAAREDVAQIKSDLGRKEDLKILNWLTTVNYGETQSDYFARRQPGTGQWLLDSKEFQGWLATNKQTLFCPGIPGAGKTILTSIVTDHLELRFRNDSETGLAFIYCNFQRQEEQNLNRLLASVLKQLAKRRPSLPESVKVLYNQHETGQTRPSLDEIIGLLQSVAAMYSRVFVIVDALDECQASGNCRKKFLTELFDLQKRHGTNIFATSRFIPDIMEQFKARVSLEIRASTNDVTRYLECHIKELPSVVQKDQQLQDEITTGISEVVDGMFLLAQLYLGLLRDKLTPNAIRSAIATFRKRYRELGKDQKHEILDRAYEQTMERINGQMSGMKELAMKVLSWIACSERQLTTLELQHALATKPGKLDLDSGDLPHIEDMISFCAGMVTVDDKSDAIRLVHYTTQEYLVQTKEQWFPGVESEITTTCITYLSFAKFESGFCTTAHKFKERLQSNPLYNYAACNWGHHASKAATPSQVVISFLQTKAKVEAASQALMVSNLYPQDFTKSQEVPRRVRGLHLAGYFGVSNAAHKLLELGHGPDLKDTDVKTPLWYAAENGHESVVKQLLAAGAYVNATATPSRGGQTVLQAAAGGGHLEVVETLLAAGANVNATAAGYSGGTALQVAAKGGYLKVVETLLAAGADVDTATYNGETALHVAAKGGYLEVVEKLIAAGADINTNTYSGGTALCVAAKGGYLEVVEKLPAAGARVNTATHSGGTALCVVAKGGYLEMAEKVLGAETDVNTTNIGDTALQAAARRGYLEVVEKLLVAGADVNSREAALQEAAREGYVEIENLLKAGSALK